ncbi:hypothetical protein M378DRAFT_112358 [Amanita muscaria Koide BX008]|uniref:C2H2-type domain-containing protein n=1 Tax=Amanita muscaria (strain Koide BX008) TaxID=946122 RepID=A0A0C2S5U6_AMAMK|nr:hypothetical protein M378DRAFT_112358 [Amanita muscaria Koide BX008]
MMKKQDDIALEDEYLCQELAGIESTGITNHFPFDENAHAQLDYHGVLSLDIPPTYEAPGPFTSSTATDPSPQLPSWPVGHFQNQGLPSIKSDVTDQIVLSVDGNEHSQPADGSTPALWPIPGPSPVEVPLEAAEEKPVVGSDAIQKAAGKRRKKDGSYVCPYRKATPRCPATFTARHNLRYHLNSHLNQKPYKCVTCSYAAASPATTKRHQSTCKGTNHPTEGNA